PLTAPSRVIVDRHGCIRIPCTTCAWEKYFTHKLGLDFDVSVNGSNFAKCSAAHHLLNRCT
ncbi:hypothetical protein ACTQ5W_06595, partial [Ligilactobacillus ruminis]